MNPYRYLLLLLCAFSAFGISTAQPTLEEENPSLRIDPIWLETNVSVGFCWAYDILADKDGNTYSVGYFQGAFGDKDTGISGQCEGPNSCNDMLFLLKKNAAGKSQWLRYASGSSRALKLAFDQQGNILMLGNLYSQKIHFNTFQGSQDSIIRGEQSGVFLCRFDTSGNLKQSKFMSEHQDEGITFALDARGNVSIGGTRYYRTAADPSLMQRAILLMHLNANWQKKWEIISDTTGNALITGMAFFGKDILVSGSYKNNLVFGKHRWKAPYNESIPFVTKFNSSGSLKWLIDSIGDSRIGGAGSLAIDQSGNSYVWSGSSYSFANLAKINPKGKLIWSHTIRGRASVYAEKILVANERIYICGQAYSTPFIGNDSEMMNLYSKGAIDPYVASYSLDGNLLWLKAFGGEGTDYCKSIAVSGNRLYAFGWTSYEMPFYRSIIKDPKMNTFYTAAFDLERMADTNANEGDPLPKPIVWPLIDSSDCSCETKPEDTYSWMNLFDNEVSQKAVVTESGWWQNAGDTTFDYLFYGNSEYYNDHSSGTDSRAYELISYQPVHWNHPDSTYRLTFFPCRTENKQRKQWIGFRSEHRIKNFDPYFDFSEFDSSAEAYLDAFLSLIEEDDEQILSALIQYHYYEFEPYPFLQPYNEKYNLNLDLTGDYQEEWLEAFVEALAAKNISFHDFLYTEFVFDGNTKPHKISPKEISKLAELTGMVGRSMTFEELNQALVPNYFFYLSGGQITLSINKDILHPKGTAEEAPFLIELEELEWSTYEGLKINVKSICPRTLEIGQTGVVVQFETLHIHDKANPNTQLASYDHPALFDYFASIDSGFPTRFSQQYLMTTFSGISCDRPLLSLPFNMKEIRLEAKGVVVNNNFLSVSIVIPIDTSFDTRDSVFYLQGFQELGTFTERTLTLHFTEHGFSVVKSKKGLTHVALNLVFISKEPATVPEKK